MNKNHSTTPGTEAWLHALGIARAFGSDAGARDGTDADADRLNLQPPPNFSRFFRRASELAPALCSAPETKGRCQWVEEHLLNKAVGLGKLTGQAAYEAAHRELAEHLRSVEQELQQRRFLAGQSPDFADVLLFVFSVRLDLVYFDLYKATCGLLSDYPALEGHARDLFELPAFSSTTDFEAIKTVHYSSESTLNPRGIVPRGGIPDLDAPHFRDAQFSAAEQASATEETAGKGQGMGEWVRPRSKERDWISADPDSRYPAEAGRYHLYAPFNCPWSHRALLGRAVKGLEDVVGASIVYFRRDPERGWQFNPRIPGCTEDRAEGKKYVVELYEAVGSSERSVPVLWDTKTKTIVSNESAEILRMFNDAFGSLACNDIDLVPASYVGQIDRFNREIYQRINNGAYKAGFAKTQEAYERAFARYFRALDWLENVLGDREWLVGSERPTEADLRLFPTVFRHDAVYYARFKLNLRRIVDYPRLSHWLQRMMDLPGVSRASNLDHARNGYFGRTGNQIVPAGPVPLELSPKNFSKQVWLNQ